MSTVIEQVESSASRDVETPSLPEYLGEKWLPIAALDLSAAAAVWFVIVIAFKDARAATVTITVLLTLAWMTGRYRRSFAAVPADEVYSTIALTLEASVILALAIPIFGIDLVHVVVGSLLWTAAAAAGTMSLCRRRRGTSGRWSGEMIRIDHLGRVRARSPMLHFQLRCADLMLSTIGLVVLCPVLAAIAVAIALDSGRPILFRQLRAGVHDCDFMMYKFRTMKNGAGDAWVTPGDARITRIGGFLRKTSLDELPQLWNVLIGNMSLVGPRPEMREYADRFSREATNYPDRHILPPGITGWAQLYCPRNLQPSDMPRVLRCDLFYVQNAGLHLYALCLVKTAVEIFTHKAL